MPKLNRLTTLLLEIEKSILQESVDYVLPTGANSAPYVMADFYMLNYLRTTDIDLLAQHKRGGAVRAHEHLDDIKFAEDEMIPKLKAQLLKDVFFALSAEIRHVFSNRNPISEDRFFMSYYRRYKSFTDTLIEDPRKPEDRDQFKNDTRGY